jgi:competence protein ComEC
MVRATDAALGRLYASIAATRTPLAVLKAGDRLGNAADGTLRVLHPPPGGIPAKDNANSIVLAVEYAGRCVLLTGDLEEQGMDLLLATPPWPCDVLLAPHHGSRRSQPDQLLAWAKPPWAVVSSGPIRSFHTAEAVYAAAQCRALHTALQGAIHFRIGRDTFEVHTYRQRPNAPLVSDQDSDTPELQEPQAWVL